MPKTSAKPSYNMSEETPEEDERIDHAGGIISAGKGKIQIVHAMKLVGFSTPERKNMTLYQRVRRRSHQMVVSIAPRTIKKSSLFEVESTLTAPEESALATSNSSSRNSRSPTDVDTDQVVTPRRLSVDTPTRMAGGTGSESTSTSTARQSGSNRNGSSQEESAGVGLLSVEEATTKKRRRSSAQVQQEKAKKQKQAELEKKAMKLATVRIKEHKSLRKGHKDKKSALTICQEVNLLCGSNISSKTAATYVQKGLVNCSPQKRGPNTPFPKKVLSALKWAYATYLKLEQAGSKRQSSIRELSL